MGFFITFEGTEGGGKTTQIQRLAESLKHDGHEVVVLREPGGTPIGEEIRHLLKHSDANHGMTPETELLLVNASRAQLVAEVIRPALARGAIVLCDRFYDSTVVYQGHGRGLDLETVRRIIDLAVGDTRPDLTFLLEVPLHVSEARRAQRDETDGKTRDRFEENGRDFFQRVEAGYRALADSEPARIHRIDATAPLETVEQQIRARVDQLLDS